MIDWHKEIKNMDGWHFGGKGSGLEDSLLELVLKGIKTATCSWYETYAVDNEPIAEVGERSYIMDSNDRPSCVIEVTKVEIMAFLDVDEEFARKEGEGDLSYEYWRNAHETYFKKSEGLYGLVWDPNTQSVVCETFKVVHVFEAN